jgi:hypothetical protein
MAPQHPGDEDYPVETDVERITLYWKKAAQRYHQACTSESEEDRAFNFRIAMAWAAMANELEHVHKITQEARPDVRAVH